MLLLINLYNYDVYKAIINVDASIDFEAEVKEAIDAYKRDQLNYIDLALNRPDSEYWEKQEQECIKKLDAGFAFVTMAEYKKLKTKQLIKEPQEITEKEFDEALNCLPPLLWVCNERYSQFFISEPTELSFHAQYIYVKATGKYYTAIADVLDKTTWLDKRFNINDMELTKTANGFLDCMRGLELHIAGTYGQFRTCNRKVYDFDLRKYKEAFYELNETGDVTYGRFLEWMNERALTPFDADEEERKYIIQKENEQKQEKLLKENRASFENACDCLRYGYGRKYWVHADDLTDEELDIIWKAAFRYMSHD